MSLFVERLLLKLRERRSTYSSRILTGNVANLEEYKFSAGKMLGIEEAEDIVKKLYKETYEGNVEEKIANE